MSKEKRYIPMLEAQTERLRTTSTFPFEIEKDIGLNVKHLQSLCQVSGFRHLTIENQDKPETSSTQNMIVGIDSQGAGISGKGATSKVPTFEHEFKPADNPRTPWKNEKWQDLTISLNTEEMKQRILTSDESVKNAEVWATELNEALTKGIVRAGVKQLLVNLNKGEIAWSLFVPFMTTMDFLNKDRLEAVAWTFMRPLLYNIVIPIFGNYENFKKGEGYRMGAFFNFELDRAAVLLFMSKLQPLAKKVSQIKE